MVSPRRFLGPCVAALLVACHTPVDETAIQTAALRELFLAREHPHVLVVWVDTARGPVFAESDSGFVPSRATPPRSVDGVPLRAVRQRELAALFQANADGWQAFYDRYPGALGLIELAPVEATGDRASLVVGRSCGEHCRFAWRVRLRRTAAQWLVTRVDDVRVPRS